mmetsp:Transcript_23983/g.49837  ORF Transcript_23983/g.49837 Transcript_23983/m.49837 type:complete len:146 (+) Transcript_23983:2790-3227(+)
MNEVIDLHPSGAPIIRYMVARLSAVHVKTALDLWERDPCGVLSNQDNGLRRLTRTRVLGSGTDLSDRWSWTMPACTITRVGIAFCLSPRPRRAILVDILHHAMQEQIATGANVHPETTAKPPSRSGNIATIHVSPSENGCCRSRS